jgi:ACS family glucarate transporter-like MFS transporter
MSITMTGAHTSRRTLNMSQALVIALLFGFSMMSYFDRTIMSIAGPQMIKDFGISATQMGGIYSAFILGYALLMMPGGHLTDWLGPRFTLTLMGVLSGLFTAAVVLAGKPGLAALLGVVVVLFVARLGLGVVTAPLYPACARMTANWIPVAFHARVQGLVIGGSSIGAAISPLLFTWMMARFQWRGSFVLAAGATVALGILWSLYARDYPRAVTPPVRTPSATALRGAWVDLFANRNLMLLTFAYGTLGYFQYIFFYWIYYYFVEVLHLGSQASAKYTGILFVTEGVFMPLGGFISDRLTRTYGAQIGRRIVPMSGLTLSAGLIYISTVSSGIGTVVACLSLAVGMAACCEGPFWASVTELAGEHVGGAGSILNTGAQIGGFFAPILTPYIGSRAGWSWGLYTGAILALTGVLAIYFSDVRPVKQSANTPAGMPQPAS